MRKKNVTGYRKSSVTCFFVRGRGLYRKSLKKTPKNRKSGISEGKFLHRPRKRAKPDNYLQYRGLQFKNPA